MTMRRQRGRPSIKWDRLSGGLALAAAGGAVFGHVWSLEGNAWWLLGSVTVLCGLLLMLSSVYARSRPARGPVPPLGEMLVQKGCITDAQLGHALARQHRYGGPIGRILVDMKLVSPVQLARLLEEQIALKQNNSAPPASEFEGDTR